MNATARRGRRFFFRKEAAPASSVKDRTELSVEELANARATLGELVGGDRELEDACDPRLGLGPDGSVMLRLRVPVMSRAQLGLYSERPWGSEAGMSWELKWFPLAEGVALLRDPEGPDAEVRRREDLLRRDKETAAAFERGRQAAAAEEAERQAETDRIAKECCADAWERLNPWQRLGYTVALVLEDEGQRSAATKLRSVLQRSDPQRGLPFPGRKW